jgi:hypothetical protein
MICGQYLKKQLSDAPTTAARRRTVRSHEWVPNQRLAPEARWPCAIVCRVIRMLTLYGKRSHTTIHVSHLVQSKLGDVSLLVPLTLSPGCLIDSRSDPESRYWSMILFFCWASVSQRITMLMQQAVLLPESPITWVVTFSRWPQLTEWQPHRICLMACIP